MTRLRVASFVALTAAVAIAACDGSTGGSNGTPFAVGIVTTAGSAGAYTMTPSIAFYRVRGAQLVNSNVTHDTCFVTGYTPAVDAVNSFAAAVSAGDSIVLSVGPSTATLLRINSLDPFYRAGAPLAFTPGDSLTVTIPGDPNGFPPGVFRAGTAESFTVDPITSLTTGSDVPVTWTPSPVAGSAMLMSFRFSSNDVALDTQVACSFIDDGSAIVPWSALAVWANATVRETEAERVRSLIAQTNAPRAYFNFASIFVQPITTP